MNNNTVKMGNLPDQWKSGIAKSITFCVTEDCNLACKYCYMTGKNNKNKLNFETAKKAIDYILSDKEEFNNPSVLWEFIGGEPFLEIELIDRICDYIKYQMYILEHPWFDSYRFSFSSNGVLYHTPAVQRYIQKNKGHVFVGLSVDGNKIKHDLQRVKPDGSGSYDDVIKNVPLWLKQFPYSSTKSTFSHDDLPYLKDSVISMWNLGIKNVLANIVFEDVWHEGDDVLFEGQLKELADYVIENRLWSDYYVRFFEANIGFPLAEEEKNTNYCGSGQILAIDTQGNFYPCVRFYDFSLNNRKSKNFGNIYDGLKSDMFRAFQGLDVKKQSPDKCLNCEVASGCAWCTGYNYDIADTDTIYQRATYICEMHKANVRATEYFWEKLSEVTGLMTERDINRISRLQNNKAEIEMKSLQFITDDTITPHCTYRNIKNSENKMSSYIFQKGLEFAKNNGFEPILLCTSDIQMNVFLDNYTCIFGNTKSIIPENSIIIYDNNADINTKAGLEICILLINKENIQNIFELVTKLMKHNERINLIIEDIDKWGNEEIEIYTHQLQSLVDLVAENYKKNNIIEINILTDILNLKSMCNCDAAENTFTLAPNGRIYMCPAFYFNNPDNHIGSLEEGINIKNTNLLKLENSYICSQCDAYHCRRCKFQNKMLTGEINTPSRIQCLISHIEREQAKQLQLKLNGMYEFKNILSSIDYYDPLDKIKNRSVMND